MCNIFRRCMKCCLGRQNNLAQVNPLPVNNVLDDTVNHDLVGQQNYQGMVNPEVPQINEDNIQEENIQEILTEDSSQNNDISIGFNSMTSNNDSEEGSLEINPSDIQAVSIVTDGLSFQERLEGESILIAQNQEILTEDSSQNNNLNNSEMNNNPLGFDSMNNSEGDEEELEIEDLVIPPNPVNEVQEEVEDNDSPPISFTVTPIE